MLYFSIAAVVVILAIAYKSELKSFFGKQKIKKKDSEDSFVKHAMHDLKHCKHDCEHCGGNVLILATGGMVLVVLLFILVSVDSNHLNKIENEPPLKEVVLTISNVKDDGKGQGYKYVKFSDGHTIKVDKDYDTEWMLAKEGDKVRKLTYANKETEYTPEFDDDINKDNAKK